MSWIQVVNYLYRATVVYLISAVAFWIVLLSKVAKPPRMLADDSFRCNFYKVLFLIGISMALLSFASSAVLWKSSSVLRRMLIVATTLMFLTLCWFNFLAWGFCAG